MRPPTRSRTWKLAAVCLLGAAGWSSSLGAADPLARWDSAASIEARVAKVFAENTFFEGGRVYAGAALTPGTPAPFSLPSVPASRLFAGDAGFRIVVPAGATRLEVRLVTSTPGVDVDLYVRFGTDVALSAGTSGTAVADYLSEGSGSNEIVAARPTSSPPLQAGTYYIALGLFTTGTAVNGTLTATVDTGPTLPIGTLLSSGAATAFTWSPVTGAMLFNGDFSYGIKTEELVRQKAIAR